MQTKHLNSDGTPKYTNRLAGATSPYLLKHAHNPVDWYPWGPEAFAKARAEGKPIHLSVGYLACHWCTVFEKESFEDPDTARVLNDNFVNIKVDREERPDIDRIYQIAQQMLTQRAGGWPLTMFLASEDRRPFFGGTYFPKEPRHGLPAFKDLLLRVSQFYRERPTELRAQNEALINAFAQLRSAAAGAEVVLDEAPLRANRNALTQLFDPHHGGFGGPPKFPQPQMLAGLLREWRATTAAPEPDLKALYMATWTLRHIADGGINDHLGGGFCRYAVDQAWMIPHFEKMLYDNAALLALYAQAAIATGDEAYARVSGEIAAWVMGEMQSPEGGYYSSLDADSEGHEGRFYVWTREQVHAALTPEEYAVFSARFGLDRAANFEGAWHLYVARPLEDVARAANLEVDRVQALLAAARDKLLAARERRVRPARDEKILTAWNALMIRGMAIAARALRREDLAHSATRALELLREKLWRDGRLLASYMDGRAQLNAYLDDYAYLADALLELQQVRFRSDEVALARALIEVLLQHFEDPADGGFYFTSDDHEQLMVRPRGFADDATAAGNGVAASVLLRFGYLLAEPRYLAAAERTLRAGWADLQRFPQAHASLLEALEQYLHPPETIIIRGDAVSVTEWQRELAAIYAPRRTVLGIPADTAGLPAALADKPAQPGRTVAYICRGSVCSAPVESLGALISALRSGGSV